MNIAPNCCHAIINLAEANSNGDNILIGNISLALLRQQDNNDENIFYSLADFVAPKTSNKVDYMGAFAISISNDINILKKSYDEQNDSYKVVLLQTICDRLAEAASEYLHLLVRKDYWGYDPNENLSLKELFSSKYVGIRPAVGYPSLPDQRIIFQLDKLLNLSEIGISLTENGAMLPTSSVCGLYFANPYAKYFAIGKIDNDQLADYASCTKTDTNQIRKYLSKNIQ
jgi:5-methyltetrahydrofolate--homocysteine methyltransferase